MFIINQKAVLLVSCALALIAAFLAKKRGQRPFFWFCLTFFFGIFGLGLFLFLNYRNQQRLRQIADHEAKALLKPQAKLFASPYLWYYLNQQNQPIGPMSAKKLIEELEKGVISETTYLWHDEMENWKPLSEIQN
ncbi:MAG: DUF4339 domain-containing protein [Parachlamydiales bacterium]|jgi:hypothetical protein